MLDQDVEEPNPLGDLTEAFLLQYRQGHAPSLEDYALRHPAHAEEIRALFPTLVQLEQRRAAGPPPDGPRDQVAQIPLRRIGDYALVRELGRGGMGIVFEARDEVLDRNVALKLLPGSAVLDDERRQRFLREARIVARLHHPHIVPIHAVGASDDVLYYVMDLVRGTSLDQLNPGTAVRGDGPTRSRWVASLGLQAAETLAYAHRQGVLHRDVKPSNFLLDEAGVLWLADFGLAKLVDEASLTTPGAWLGTLRYLAPECLRGESNQRSDIYGLGLTLYELLVGIPAFDQEDRARLIQQIVDSAPVPPSHLDPTIPPAFEAILARACQRDPERRYPSADALADDLRRFLDGQSVLAPAPRPLTDAHPSSRYPLHWLAIAATLALMLFAAALFFAWRSSPDPAQAAAATPAPAPAASAAEPTPTRPPGPPWGWGGRRNRGANSLGRGPRGPQPTPATPVRTP